MGKNTVSLTFDSEVYAAYQKRIGRGNVSHSIEEFMRKSLGDETAEGTTTTTATTTNDDPKVVYDRLKHEYDQALAEVEKRVDWLKKHKVFDDLRKLVNDLKVPREDGWERFIPKMREAWKGSRDDLQYFIMYMQDVRRKDDILSEMDKIMGIMAPQNAAPPDVTSPTDSPRYSENFKQVWKSFSGKDWRG